MKDFITHPLIKPNTVEYRKYQKNIAETAIDKNTLCVLPTGMGKTVVAVLASVELLKNNPNKKILILSPSKPLCAQHQEVFQKTTSLEPSKIKLITGEIRPSERKGLYNYPKIIIATPQTIKNDVKNEIINLDSFSLVVFDESHKAVKNYSYTFLSEEYIKNSNNGRILALTASPGSSKKKIDRVCKNLFIDSVQIRSREDKDVKPYIKDVKLEYEYVHLPKKFKIIRKILQEFYDKKLKYLKEKEFVRSTRVPKRVLISLQKKISASLSSGNPHPLLYTIVTKTAAALKISYTLELLETQGILPLRQYFKKLDNDDTRAAKRLLKKEKFQKAQKIVEDLYQQGSVHPKLPKLLEIVRNELKRNLNSKIIVFVRYRDSVDQIIDSFKKEEINVGKLIGQQKGLTQEEQINVLKEFKKGDFNVLVTTSIGEEGLDIPTCNLAVFYDTVSSAVRSIQRKGRVGRTKPGRVIFLITKDTRDEAYYWSAYHKEKKMRKTLREYQKKGLDFGKQQELDGL